MPRIDENTRSQRKERIWLEVRQNNGIRQSEISERLNLENRTVNNYLRELGDEGKIFKEGILWYALPYHETRLRRFALEPEEAMTLYLASRLFVKQQDRRNEPAESALYRLAEVLTADAGVGYEIRQAAQELAQRPTDPSYPSIFREIIRGYIYRRKVQITYQPYRGREFEALFSTYLIEPSAIGYSTYIIGHSSTVDDIRSYKVERIRTATITSEEYQIPASFPGLDILRNAWSIITGDKLQRVVLRFSPTVKKRVLETQWHPSQDFEEEAGGPLRWWVEVADTTDMKPWIRGWGGDVEVLEPPELRQELKETATRLNKLYGTESTAKLLHHIPYAKTNSAKREEIHLLLYHLIDVGQVALAMWQDVLAAGARQRLSQILKLNEDECGRFLAFIAGLHDLGKAGPAYQKKYAPPELKTELIKAGLVLDGVNRAYDKSTPHGTVSTWALSALLPDLLGIDERFSRKIAIAVGGHHGIWPQPDADLHIDDSKHGRWDTLRRDLVWELKAVFDPPAAVSLPESTAEQNAFLTILSGLTSVADWIGSRNDECFGYIEKAMSSRQYATYSAVKAREGLQDLGWIGWLPSGQVGSFADSFSYLDFDAPRPVQQQVIEAVHDLEPPSLLILEAPTGIGKSEAALHIADTFLQRDGGRGLYVAMPTQATSNQMYGRVGQFLKHRYTDMPINYHLVHGQAAWMDELKKAVELQGVGDDEKARITAESWFNPRKRTLLAPFGVGTVDQTLLSILQTKHFFVRLFALSHKVIIFDEVHAYDTYMNTLFHRLLEWLSAIGTSVIILSATLPAKTRCDLVKAYTGQQPEVVDACYPALTIANAQKQETIRLPEPEPYVLGFNWSVGRQPEEIADFLQGQLAGGGCAAVICNTVRRAQDVYRAIKLADIVPHDELILFHGRFPPVWRKEIEEKVLGKFGKDGRRPHKAVVVATQVIEQSLDLDFDVMVTDLAPIDLILQRAGRLHRHIRDTQERHNHSRQLTITQPDFKEDIPDFGPDSFVYSDYLLLRTYLALHNRSQVV
ncbi:MAG: CRISPR-associated helicase Cas3', partial [Candidatus Promineifilaceae bacterium]